MENKYHPPLEPEFQKGLRSRIQEKGFSGILELVQAFPLANTADIGRMLEVPPVQVRWLFADEGAERGLLRLYVKELLVRMLRCASHGWTYDEENEAYEDLVHQLLFWANTLEEEVLREKMTFIANDLLDNSDLPIGWLPLDQSDSYITAVFEKHWPEPAG